jgi:hypothetical protein
MQLPIDQIFEICQGVAQQNKYNLRSLQKIEGFFEKVQNLASSYIDTIHFNHLMRQKESEKLENNLFPDEDHSAPCEEEDRETNSEEDDREEEEEVEIGDEKVLFKSPQVENEQASNIEHEESQKQSKLGKILDKLM